MPLEAKLRVVKGMGLPLSKLEVSGSVADIPSLAASATKAVAAKSVVFVIDVSGSMIGHRIRWVKHALVPFLQCVCEQKHLQLRLVTFNTKAQSIVLPNSSALIQPVLERALAAGGGTNFEQAAVTLTATCSELLRSHPKHQLSVIFCSDGEVGKDNARRAHAEWKSFVSDKYQKQFGAEQWPYVESIGLSLEHDADVLDGFICDDDAGHYCRVQTEDETKQAFDNAMESALSAQTYSISIALPVAATRNVYAQTAAAKMSGEEKKSEDSTTATSGALSFVKVHDVVLADEHFSETLWVDAAGIGDTAGGDWQLQVSGVSVPLAIERLAADSKDSGEAQECQNEAIEYFHAMLSGMLEALRATREESTLKALASSIEKSLDKNTAQLQETCSALPEKNAIQLELRQLLENSEMAASGEGKAKRASLMRKYKAMNKVWRERRGRMTALEKTQSELKSVLREVTVGSGRMQEVRQHIVDLHFRRRHKKRADRLVLSQSQLDSRAQRYAAVELPTAEECADIADDEESGCFLSLVSMREAALCGDPLWICGRVSRVGGAAVSNPELIRIECISRDLVSESSFRTALETTADGFKDSTRELINARLFPVYGNASHLRATQPFLFEAMSQTLSGRTDIRCVDCGALWATVGHLAANAPRNDRMLQLLFDWALPSLRLLSASLKGVEYAEEHLRQPKASGKRLPLATLSRMRLQRYLAKAKCRTSGLVSVPTVLFADALLHNIPLADARPDFWLSLVLLRLRQAVRSQLPTDIDKVEEMREAKFKQATALRLIVCGLQSVDSATAEETKDASSELLSALPCATIGAKKRLKLKPEHTAAVESVLFDDSDAAQSKEMLQMCAQLFARIYVADLSRAHAFFAALASLKKETPAVSDYSAFKEESDDAFANDFCDLLLRLGFDLKDARTVEIVRVLCAVALVTPSNKDYHSHLALFESELLSAPRKVLQRIHTQFVVAEAQFQWRLHLEKQRLAEVRAIHHSPLLPDDVDEFGNMPQLRCGWKRCAQVFDNRDRLLHHVAHAISDAPLCHRFHLHCRAVLELKPSMPLEEFIVGATKLITPERMKKCDVSGEYLVAYYEQFAPIFKKLS